MKHAQRMPLVLPLSALLALSLAGACQTKLDAQGDNAGEENSDTPFPSAPDAGQPPEPEFEPVPESQIVTLQAGSSTAITPNNSIACNSQAPNFINSETRFFRTYELPALGIDSDFFVSSVDIGIQEAVGVDGTQNIGVALSTFDGGFAPSQVVISALEVDVPDQEQRILNVPIEATIPAGSTLLFEVYIPDGTTEDPNVGDRLYLGSNPEPESSPSYIVAESCGIASPSEIAKLGVEGLAMSLVLNVTGVYTGL